MAKNTGKTLAAAVGAAFLASAGLSTSLSAAENPFQLNDLGSGYKVADSHEGKCGEGKCGEGKKSEGEGKCGEGKCGEGMKAEGEGKCGESTGDGKAEGEGKCGEGKCGGKS